MDQPIVISVNPGIKTPGAIREEGLRYDDFNTRLAATIAQKPQLENSLNLITGIGSMTASATSYKILSLRIILGVCFIAAAAYAFINVLMPVALISVILSFSYIAGFGTRLTSLAAIGFVGWLAYSEMLSMEYSVIIALPALVMCILGPGIYSLDQICKKAYFKFAKGRASKEVTSDNLNYKAYTSLR